MNTTLTTPGGDERRTATQRFLDAIGRPDAPRLTPEEKAAWDRQQDEVDAAAARRYGTEGETLEQARDRIAQQAAEYIHGILLPKQQRLIEQANGSVTVIYPGQQHPPTDVEAIKRTLLFSEVWAPWLDERVSIWLWQLAGLRDETPA